MKISLQKLLSKTHNQEVPSDLLKKIMSRIEAKQRKQAIVDFALWSAVFLATVGFSIPVLVDLHSSMIQSGSYQYISLIFSNFSDVMASWQDFALSLLEYLPIISIAIFLGIVFFLLASVRFITRDAKILFFRHF